MSFVKLADELNQLRQAAPGTRLDPPAHDQHTPPVRTAQSVVVAGMTVQFTDRPSLDTQIKDIFEQRIYDFQPSRPDPVIIDGGASIGLSTLYWKRAIPAARVICFEPDLLAADLLRRNVEANGMSNIDIIPAGLSDRTGTASFEPDGADGGRMTAQSPSAAPHRAISINTVQLSTHVQGPIDLLKLNVEGQELSVLRELEASSKLSHVHRIILEYHGWQDGQQLLADILTLLDRNGFRYLIHDFDKRTNPASKPPFKLRAAPWFCLVYAERTQEAASRGAVRFGDLRRISPISRVFGLDRGTAVDRYYIERFLAASAGDVRGTVLEVADDSYTRRFGGDRVQKREILFAPPGHPRATYIADIGKPNTLPAEAFDCIILTQTLHCIYDIKTAIENCRRALRSGGVLLATVPGISQISRYDMDRWGDFWRLTTASARRLLGEVFSPNSVTITAHGNVLAATAFLQGLSAEELNPFELDHHDPDYELLITIRAEKPL